MLQSVKCQQQFALISHRDSRYYLFLFLVVDLTFLSFLGWAWVLPDAMVDYIVASIAFKSFLCPLLSHVILLLAFFHYAVDSFIVFLSWQMGFTGLFLAIFLIQHRRDAFHMAIIVRSLGLGLVFSIGGQICLLAVNHQIALTSPLQLNLGLYLLTLAIFHLTEFLTTALNQPNTVTTDAFLLNHSREYHFALLVSLLEYLLEGYLLPQWKFAYPPLAYIGFGVCLTGEAIRKVAMFTAGRNFTHVIADEHQPDHFLVTDGIYGIWRHPSYVGWFYWSVGTQIILLNPISFLGYTIVSWRFFRERIYYEEITLARFFGARYLDYKAEVPTGLPFIDGF